MFLGSGRKEPSTGPFEAGERERGKRVETFSEGTQQAVCNVGEGCWQPGAAVHGALLSAAGP